MYRTAILKDGRALARVDGNPSLDRRAWVAHAADEYGVPVDDLEVVEFDRIEDDPRDLGRIVTPPAPELQPPPPDVGGFLLALYASTAAGGLGEDRAIALAQARPDFTLAMQRERFDLARGIVERIRARNLITDAEHAAILAAFEAFHIPEA